MFAEFSQKISVSDTSKLYFDEISNSDPMLSTAFSQFDMDDCDHWLADLNNQTYSYVKQRSDGVITCLQIDQNVVAQPSILGDYSKACLVSKIILPNFDTVKASNNRKFEFEDLTLSRKNCNGKEGILTL
jgi:hypothetical protein